MLHVDLSWVYPRFTIGYSRIFSKLYYSGEISRLTVTSWDDGPPGPTVPSPLIYNPPRMTTLNQTNKYEDDTLGKLGTLCLLTIVNKPPSYGW